MIDYALILNCNICNRITSINQRSQIGSCDGLTLISTLLQNDGWLISLFIGLTFVHNELGINHKTIVEFTFLESSINVRSGHAIPVVSNFLGLAKVCTYTESTLSKACRSKTTVPTRPSFECTV